MTPERSKVVYTYYKSNTEHTETVLLMQRSLHSRTVSRVRYQVRNSYYSKNQGI